MKINNWHLSAAAIVAGLIISGCSQQQTAAAVPVVESVPEAVPVVDYVPEPAPQPVQRPAPVVKRPAQKRCWHGVNAQGECNPSPEQQRPAPVMPKVKAKGNYRGAVQIDNNALQQYRY